MLYGLSTVVGRLLNYLLVPLHTRLFNPSEYGIITDFYAWAALGAVIYTYGMETAYFRFCNKEPKSSANASKVYASGFYALLFSSVILSLVLWVGADHWAGLLKHHGHSNYVRWFAIIFAVDAISALPFAKLRQEGRSVSYVALKFSNIIILIGLQLYFLWYNPPLPLVSGLTSLDWVILSNVLANSLTLLLLVRVWPPILDFRFSTLKPMWAYAWPLLLAGLAGMLNETLDRIMLKFRWAGTTEEALGQIGIYGAVYKLSILMSLFTQAFRMGAEPYFLGSAASIHDDDSTDARPTTPRYGEVFWYYSLAGWGIFLMVMLWVDAAKAFIGTAFHQGLPVLPILLAANLCLGWYYNHSVWFKRSDQTQWGLWLGLGSAVITVAGNWWGIPLYGYTACAWVTLLCYGTLFGTSVLIGHRKYPIEYPWRAWFMLGLWALSLLTVDHLWVGQEITARTAVIKILLLGALPGIIPLAKWLKFVP
jgi:O-antigen/teichoic acid export membrane protein